MSIYNGKNTTHGITCDNLKNHAIHDYLEECSILASEVPEGYSTIKGLSKQWNVVAKETDEP